MQTEPQTGNDQIPIHDSVSDMAPSGDYQRGLRR